MYNELAVLLLQKPFGGSAKIKHLFVYLVSHGSHKQLIHKIR